MLPRTEFELSEAIRDFMVVTLRGTAAGLRGAAFLQPHDRRDPLAGGARTRQDARRRAGKSWKRWSQEASEYELDAVFAFTYVAEFFSKVGFHVVERGVLPLKAGKIACAAPSSRRATKSPCCGFCGRIAGRTAAAALGHV